MQVPARNLRSSLGLALVCVGLLSPLAVAKLTTSLLFIPMLGLLLWDLRTKSFRKILFEIAFTPFTPFVLILVLLSPFQENLAETYALLAIASAFIFSRLMRLSFSIRNLLVGVSVSGFVVGLLYLAGVSQLGQQLRLQLIFTSFGGKQSVGWALAFGVLASFVLLVGLGERPMSRYLLLTGLIGLQFGMLYLVDSLSSFAAAAGAIFVVSALAIARGGKKTQPAWVAYLGSFGLAASVLGVLVILLSNFWSSSSSEMTLLRRDFGSLTGRDVIWSCYFEAVGSGKTDVWKETADCVFWPISDLHNVFLQSHLVGGFSLVFLLALGILWALATGVAKFLRAEDLDDLIRASIAVGAVVIGIVIGNLESFLYYPIGFATTIFFLFSDSASPKWGSKSTRLKQTDQKI